MSHFVIDEDYQTNWLNMAQYRARQRKKFAFYSSKKGTCLYSFFFLGGIINDIHTYKRRDGTHRKGKGGRPQCGNSLNLLPREKKIFPHRKIFRQINSLVTSWVKTLLSRNFCWKSVWVSFCHFHTVSWKTSNRKEPRAEVLSRRKPAIHLPTIRVWSVSQIELVLV